MKITASKPKKKLIAEALKAWNKFSGNKRHKQLFIDKMIKLGWKHDDWGTFKHVLYKGSIVVKFNRMQKDERNEVLSEYRQYLYANSELKKHLAGTYGLFDGLLIQDKVYKKGVEKAEKRAKNLAKRLKLRDFSQNYGISKAGVIKFHDIVDYKFLK